MGKISRLKKKAVSENESYTGDIGYVSGIVFPEGYDEVENNPSIREFVSSFQIMQRQNLPIYLIMTGLYDNRFWKGKRRFRSALLHKAGLFWTYKHIVNRYRQKSLYA